MKRKPFQEELSDLWADEFVRNHLCGLCGNAGVIDTTGRAVSAAGVHSGGKFFCICPNGRVLRAQIGKTVPE